MDTRKKLETDIRQWLDSRLIGNEVFETIISWLDRQEAITERQCRSITEPYEDAAARTIGDLGAALEETTRECDKLRKQLEEYNGDCYRGATSVEWYEHSVLLETKVDELTNERDRLEDMTEQLSEEVDVQRINYTIAFARAEKAEDTIADLEKTHMRLPVDADGVPIRPGDKLVYRGTEPFMCYAVSEKHAHTWDAAANAIGHLACKCRHVQPETVEGILAEAMSFACEPEAPFSENSKYVKQYAERIRKAVEHG